MKRKINLKKLLAAVSLLTIVIPSSLNVVACGKKESKAAPKTDTELVVNAINNTLFKISIMAETRINDLKDLINSNFIKKALNENIEKLFKEEEFVLNKITKINITKINNEELLDSDLKKVAKINVKINYDYGKFTNQTTNLEINIQAKRKLLSDTFKDFEFKDEKGIINFLDTNNLNVITNQIETFLGKSLDEGGLILENQQGTSIILKAKPESKKYQGEIKLTWNLKLFEIYGMEKESEYKWIGKGLKGYFYLESGTNKIKYFDAVWYFNYDDRDSFNKEFYNYHQFYFINQNNEEKKFIFVGKWWTDQIATEFASFDFTKEVKVKINSPELRRIKVFNKLNHQWESLIKVSNFIINFSGEINEIN